MSRTLGPQRAPQGPVGAMRSHSGLEGVCPCTTREPSLCHKDTWRRLTLGSLLKGGLLLGVGKILANSKNPVLKSAIIYSKPPVFVKHFFGGWSGACTRGPRLMKCQALTGRVAAAL